MAAPAAVVDAPVRPAHRPLHPLRFALAALLLAPVGAAAHDLGARAQRKDGRMHVEAYFDDDKPARDAKITITDAAQMPVADGRTDSEGRWSCPAPPPGTYSVRLVTADGHKSTINVTIPAGDGDGEVVISEGPPRDEFTRPRWLGLAAGVVLIVALVIASRVLLRQKAPD